MQQVKWGVLSTAKIGREWVIPALRRARNCDLVAVASRTEDQATSLASDMAIPMAYGSYEHLLEDPDIDAVYNPLPNHLHAEWTIAAARAGKHVLCEKPLGLDAGEARRIADACEAEGVQLMEAFMYRWHPQWVAIRDIVASGRIGEVVAIDAWFSYFNDDPANIRHRAEYGGGALMDIGCYPINISRLFLGDDIVDVQASMIIDAAFGVDITTSAILDYGHAHAAFTVSTQAEASQRVTVHGTEGRVWTDLGFNVPTDHACTISLTHQTRTPWEPAIDTISVEPADQYAIQAEAFAGAILSGVPAEFGPDDAIANMAVIDRVFQAAGRTSTGPA